MMYKKISLICTKNPNQKRTKFKKWNKKKNNNIAKHQIQNNPNKGKKNS